MAVKVIRVWTENRGWIDVDVERDYDRAFDKAKQLEYVLGSDARVMVEDGKTGKQEYRTV